MHMVGDGSGFRVAFPHEGGVGGLSKGRSLKMERGIWWIYLRIMRVHGRAHPKPLALNANHCLYGKHGGRRKAHVRVKRHSASFAWGPHNGVNF